MWIKRLDEGDKWYKQYGMVETKMNYEYDVDEVDGVYDFNDDDNEHVSYNKSHVNVHSTDTGMSRYPRTIHEFATDRSIFQSLASGTIVHRCFWSRICDSDGSTKDRFGHTIQQLHLWNEYPTASLPIEICLSGCQQSLLSFS